MHTKLEVRLSFEEVLYSRYKKKDGNFLLSEREILQFLDS